MIGWYFGLGGILIGLAGGIYFVKSIMNMAGELKSSIFYLVAASFIYVLFSSIMVILGLIKYPLEELLWEIVPFLFFLSTILFVIGSYRLVILMSSLSKKGVRR